MRRRDFIGALIAAASAVPFAARGQTPERPLRIGQLVFGVPAQSRTALAEAGAQFAVMHQQLRNLGYIEGQNILFETRNAAGQRASADELARELVAWPADIIVAHNSIVAMAAKRVTSKVPVVMILVTDAVGQGLVASLARPGGNVTGMTTLSAELAPKRLELLKELVPGLQRVALLATASNAASAMSVREAQQGAQALGIALEVHEMRAPDDLEPAFAAVARVATGAILVMPGSFPSAHKARIFALANAHGLPVMYPDKNYAREGGLLSYGPDYDDLFRRAAFFVDRIAKGASPAELPVEQPTKLELAVNLKAAEAIGIAIPPAILARADEVIE